MANAKISQLPSATTVEGADLLPIVDVSSSTTQKATISQIIAAAGGVTGPAGAQGATGVAGSAGAQGATGVQGAQGATGVAGSAGAQGATGVQGAQGATGLGVQGATGLAGAAGASGVQGATGVQGLQGATGVAVSGGGGSTLDLTFTTTGLTAGDACYVTSGGVAAAADATAISTANALGIVQTVGNASTGKIRTQGIYEAANFATGLTLVTGQTAYLSKTAGKLTNDVSSYTSGNVYLPIGVITKVNSASGGTGAADVAVNVDLLILV